MNKITPNRTTIIFSEVTQFKLGQSTKFTFGVNNRRLALDFAKKSALKTGPVIMSPINLM